MAIKLDLLGGTDIVGGDDALPADWNDTFNAALDIVPIGAILDWHKSLAGTPSLPSNFVECNGQVLSDSASVYDTLTMPDLNGTTDADRMFTRGSTTSGGTGGTENHSHTAFTTGTGWSDGQGTSLGGDATMGSGAVSSKAIDASKTAVTSDTNNIPPVFNVVKIIRVK